MTKQKHFYLFRGLIREKGHWGPFLDLMKQSFPDAKISAFDIPGAGDYHKYTSPITVKGMVEEMRKDYLKEKINGEDSHLVAISLGGMIATEWMKNYPEDFHQATLINTSLGGLSPVFSRLLPSAFLFLLKVPLLKGREKESRILQLVSNNHTKFNETLTLWEQIQMERPVSLNNTLRQLLAGALYRVGNFTPSIPVTILAAINDRMVSVNCSREIAKSWKTPILEHPSAGHDLTGDDPEWVVEQLKKITSK
jgi:pimeloyl-ACP methyl ester carboxylesterase